MRVEKPLFQSTRLVRRKFPNQNIVTRLRDRELNYAKPGSEMVRARQIYTSVYPNATVVNVEKPNCFLRKFSPCGQFLIAFSQHQNAVEIYEFRGADAAGQFLVETLEKPETKRFQDAAGDYGKKVESFRFFLFHEKSILLLEKCDYSLFGSQFVDVEGEADRITVRQNLFSKFFRLKHSVALTQGNEQLNRECSLFTVDGRYLIVAAAAIIHEEQTPRMGELFRNNESITPTSTLQPEDYWLYSVDIHSGQLMDTRRFKCDRIFLAHNQGLCLYNHTLAVLSVQHQTIHVFRIDEDGHFIELQSIGRFLYDDDDMSMNAVMEWTYKSRQPANPRVQPSADPMLNGLKQRIMAFLYKQAKADHRENGDMYALRDYYRFFEFYRWLRMWRMQLLDENHLLIRLATEDVVSMRVDATSQTSFFVFYNIPETRVLAVYQSVSEDLLSLYENYYDSFRGMPADRFISTFCNSLEARRAHERFKETIHNAKYGGYGEAIRRVLLQLPISAQSFNPSPYLDMELFSYDDKWVSFYERPRPCSEYPIRYSYGVSFYGDW